MEFPYASSLPDANKQVISCVLFLFVLVVKKLYLRSWNSAPTLLATQP